MDASIEILKEKRLNLKWTTKELAEKANVPHSAVLRIEKGIGKWPDYISSVNKVLNNALIQKLFGYNRRVKVQPNYVNTLKIQFRSIKRGKRLEAALEHAKTLADSLPDKKPKIPKKYFTPKFNLIACKWFELFDREPAWENWTVT